MIAKLHIYEMIGEMPNISFEQIQESVLLVIKTGGGNFGGSEYATSFWNELVLSGVAAEDSHLTKLDYIL